MAGVAGVWTAAELDLPPMPAGGAPDAMARPGLARGTGRFLGEAGAVGGGATRAPARGAGRAPEAMAGPVLAGGTVRFLGEAVAVVVADTRAQAMDAAEAVDVDYEPLEVLTDPAAALADGAPRLFEEGATWPRSAAGRSRPGPL